MRGLITRRRFLSKAAPVPVLAGMPLAWGSRAVQATPGAPRIRISCNLYSFNAPLRSGEMTLEDVLDFCAELGFDAVDPTAYYFPTYPEAPDDAYLYRIKRKAFLLGLDISGTGVRNDFTAPDPQQRAADVALVRRWLACAAKLGAPVLRVFAGKGVPEGYTEDEAYTWVIDAIKECASYGKDYGVLVVLQNHAELLHTADDVLRVLRGVDSEWMGLNVDIGSFRTDDPYEDIARVAPYACTWQIKENVYIRDEAVKTDLPRVVRILRDTGYRGYIPIETLGPGDPRVKVPGFLEEVRAAL